MFLAVGNQFIKKFSKIIPVYRLAIPLALNHPTLLKTVPSLLLDKN